jgi:hypothetical protein
MPKENFASDEPLKKSSSFKATALWRPEGLKTEASK